MNHIRSKEEVADLYRRHGSMVYQICLMLLKTFRTPRMRPKPSFAR